MTYRPVTYPSPDGLLGPTRALVCNGIGPAKGTSLASLLFWALAWLPLGIAWSLGLQRAFRHAGDVHDLLYFMGGDWTDKRLADGVFVGLLLDSVGHWGVVFRPFGWVLALLYFCLVASCGWGSFRFRGAPLAALQVSHYAREELL